MKVTVLILTLFIIGSSGYSQKPNLPQEVIEDFSSAFYFGYKHQNNGGLRSCAYLTGDRLGYNPVDIEVAVEDLNKYVKFREELFKVILELYKADQEFLTLNFISIGMKASFAKMLSKYIVSRYGQKDKMLINEQPSSSIQILPSFGVIKYSYKALIDSLNKGSIDYVTDSSILDEVFVGYSLKTQHGEFFILSNRKIGSYSFEVSRPIQDIVNLLKKITTKATLISEDNYVFYYQEIVIQVHKMDNSFIKIVYNRRT